jgi:hypothetical protein
MKNIEEIRVQFTTITEADVMDFNDARPFAVIVR